jgi:hypothetical protein
MTHLFFVLYIHIHTLWYAEWQENESERERERAMVSPPHTPSANMSHAKIDICQSIF